MLAIGRALVMSPDLLILDEPSLGLAPLAVDELFLTLDSLKTEGHTILLSEQNAKKALLYADRAYVFEVGNIVLEGIPQEIADDDRMLRYYLGRK